MAARPRRGVLFDVDGTLIDTTFLHTVCWWQALRQFDRDVPMAVVHRAVGMGADNLVAHVCSEAVPETSALAAAHDALYAAYWPSLRLLPGARELLRRCHDDGYVTVLASSAAAAELTVVLQVLDSDDVIDAVTSSADAQSSKPDPEIVQQAMANADLTAADTVFVGDAVWDVQACTAASVRCIGLQSGGTSSAELMRAGAVETWSDAADLLAHYEHSILAQPRQD